MLKKTSNKELSKDLMTLLGICNYHNSDSIVFVGIRYIYSF